MYGNPRNLIGGWRVGVGHPPIPILVGGVKTTPVAAKFRSKFSFGTRGAEETDSCVVLWWFGWVGDRQPPTFLPAQPWSWGSVQPHTWVWVLAQSAAELLGTCLQVA